MHDACTSSNSLLEFRLGSIRPSGLKDIMIQTLAEWHMKDRAKGLPPLSELNQRPSKQGIQITVQHLVLQDRTRPISGMVQANF
jgi:hypothetical protein